jgi:hypothetical protein
VITRLVLVFHKSRQFFFFQLRHYKEFEPVILRPQKVVPRTDYPTQYFSMHSVQMNIGNARYITKLLRTD